MSNADLPLPLPLLIFYGIVGVFLLVTFVSACWMAATTTRSRRRSRRW
ncbi:hypothetical protein [Actinomadura sp. 3N407]